MRSGQINTLKDALLCRADKVTQGQPFIMGTVLGAFFVLVGGGPNTPTEGVVTQTYGRGPDPEDLAGEVATPSPALSAGFTD